MNRFKTWATNRGLGPANVFLFVILMGIATALSLQPFTDEELEPFEDESSADDILEGIKNGTYVPVTDERGKVHIYKKIEES